MDYTLVATLLYLLPGFLCQRQSEDPLCLNKVCPTNQVCRTFKPCGLLEQCSITAICTDVTSNRGGCMVGDPILFRNNGALENLYCYTEAPCPNNAYCSTLLQDVSSVCCRSDPVQTVKDGVCPTIAPDPSRFFCVDQCKSDGDCFRNDKCCSTECSLGCTPPTAPPPTPPGPARPVAKATCENMACPANQVCRLLKPCGLLQQCDVQAICTTTTPGRGGCTFGDPILFLDKGTQKDLSCYPGASCPSGAYCSTALQDVASVCCLSDPAQTVKPGVCPASSPDPSRYFCEDQCKADGDCSWDSKCCNTGCSLECVPPESVQPPTPPTTKPVHPPMFGDACDYKSCPRFMYCRRQGAPCRTRRCQPVGECNACPSANPWQLRFFQFGLDPDGCPVPIRPFRGYLNQRGYPHQSYGLRKRSQYGQNNLLALLAMMTSEL